MNQIDNLGLFDEHPSNSRSQTNVYSLEHNSAKSLPARPPPPPPSVATSKSSMNQQLIDLDEDFNKTSDFTSLNEKRTDSPIFFLSDKGYPQFSTKTKTPADDPFNMSAFESEVKNLNIKNNTQSHTLMNNQSFPQFFKQSTKNLESNIFQPKKIIDPFGMTSLEEVIQPLQPIPQPRFKKKFINQDLLLLGDPGLLLKQAFFLSSNPSLYTYLGTPPPPPPPSSITATRPITLNINKVDTKTDLALLGSPGNTPPTPPPILFN